MEQNTTAHTILFDHDGNQYTRHHQLLLAVLHRAIIDYLDDTHDTQAARRAQGYRKSPTTRTEAEWYFFREGNGDRHEPFSFAWIAEHIADDPSGFMAGIRRRLKDAPKRTQVRQELGRYENVFRKGVSTAGKTEV